MKRVFKVLVVILAIGSLIQAVALGKVKTGENSDDMKGKSSTGPGI